VTPRELVLGAVEKLSLLRFQVNAFAIRQRQSVKSRRGNSQSRLVAFIVGLCAFLRATGEELNSSRIFDPTRRLMPLMLVF